MKNVKKVFLLALLCLQALQCAYAYDFIVDGIAYDITSMEKRTVGVTNVSDKEEDRYSGNIIIPETIFYNGSKYTVSSIGKKSFYMCAGLSSIQLPETIEYFEDGEIVNAISITSGCFMGCKELKSIKFPSSLKKIGAFAFNGCSSIETINIPDYVTEIGRSSFSHCQNLKSVTLSKNIKTIERNTFDNCVSLTDIIIPEGVTSIEWNAFRLCI